MNRTLAELPLVFAQDGGAGSFYSTILLFAPLLFIFYFLFLRPQRQEEQKRRAMIDALKKNDEVLTSGGIYGTVVSVDPAHDRVVLRVDDKLGVKLAFSRASVAKVIEPSTEKPAESG
jgi:preprotein translocase subunit YajC